MKKSEKNIALKLNTYSNGYHIAALKSVHFMDKQQDSFSCTKNHTHNFYELAIVLRGAGFHIVADQKMQIRPGSIFLLCPGEYHHYEYSSPLTLLNFMFDSTNLRSFRRRLADLPGYKQLFQRGTPKSEFHVDSATIAELDILLNTMAMESRRQMPWSSLLLTTVSRKNDSRQQRYRAGCLIHAAQLSEHPSSAPVIQDGESFRKLILPEIQQ